MKKYKKEYHFDNIDLYVYFENEAREIIENFSSVEQMYVADGHHRLYTSSMLKDKDNVFSCFLSFSQVTISPIHRVIRNIDATETVQILAYIHIWSYIQGEGTVSLRADGEDGVLRSEERRVGKECRSRWSPYH